MWCTIYTYVVRKREKGAEMEELKKIVEMVKSDGNENSAKVVYYEENELGVVFAAVLGESGTVYHVNAYGNITSYDAKPVAL